MKNTYENKKETKLIKNEKSKFKGANPSICPNNQNGITLVALVVTIIVLLILAAVSLRIVAGSDGILNRASKAVDATEIATAKEQAELFLVTTISEYYEQKYINMQNVGSKLDFIKEKIDDGVQLSKDYYLKLVDEGMSKMTKGKELASLENLYATVEEITELNFEIYKGTSSADLKILEGTMNSDGKIEWKELLTNTSGDIPTPTPTPTPTPDPDPEPEPETYTITYNANDGTENSATTIGTKTEGVSYTIIANPFTVPTGKEFQEWNTSADGTGISYSPTDSYEADSVLILYAIWRNETLPVLQAIADATHYGDYFDLGTNLIDKENTKLEGNQTMLTDWRIFSRDENGVWLISADYMPINRSDINTLITGTGSDQIGLVTKTGDDLNTYPYSIWSSISAQDSITKLKSNKWKEILPSNLQNNTNITAVGALTVSQWLAGWNSYYTTASDQISLDGDETNGYTSIDISSKTGYNNTLYFSHKSEFINNKGYWLASPTGGAAYYPENRNHVMLIFMNGGINHSYYYREDVYGIRPAVHLGSSINIVQNATTGTWSIVE